MAGAMSKVGSAIAIVALIISLVFLFAGGEYNDGALKLVWVVTAIGSLAYMRYAEFGASKDD